MYRNTQQRSIYISQLPMLPALNDELRHKNVLSWTDADVGLWLQQLGATLQAFLGAYVKRYDVADHPRVRGRGPRRGGGASALARMRRILRSGRRLPRADRDD